MEKNLNHKIPRLTVVVVVVMVLLDTGGLVQTAVGPSVGMPDAFKQPEAVLQTVYWIILKEYHVDHPSPHLPIVTKLSFWEFLSSVSSFWSKLLHIVLKLMKNPFFDFCVFET